MLKIKTIFIKTIIIIFIIIVLFLCYDKVKGSTPASTKPSIRLPIIMYHEVHENSNKLGKYTISPREFEEDLIYLKKEGYTTINIEDLIAFEYNNVNLPEKPIMLTFDDGYSSNYKYIFPILQKYDCKAIISVVGEYVDKSTKNPYPNGFLNWSQVKELVDSDYVEIQNHTYAMHKLSKRKGCDIIKGESFDEFKKNILDDVGYLQHLIEEKTGYTPKAFTYPFGIISKEGDEIIKDMGFLATFSCYSGVNLLTSNKDELYQLKRFNRPSGINRVRFFEQFDK